MGQPKITPSVKQQIIGAIRAGATMAVAAKVAGVSRNALYKRLKRDKRFAEQMREAKDFADGAVVRALYKNATEQGNVVAQIFWLKNRDPENWRDRVEQEQSGEVKHIVEVQYVDGPGSGD